MKMKEAFNGIVAELNRIEAERPIFYKVLGYDYFKREEGPWFPLHIQTIFNSLKEAEEAEKDYEAHFWESEGIAPVTEGHDQFRVNKRGELVLVRNKGG